MENYKKRIFDSKEDMILGIQEISSIADVEVGGGYDPIDNGRYSAFIVKTGDKEGVKFDSNSYGTWHSHVPDPENFLNELHPDSPSPIDLCNFVTDEYREFILVGPFHTIIMEKVWEKYNEHIIATYIRDAEYTIRNVLGNHFRKKYEDNYDSKEATDYFNELSIHIDNIMSIFCGPGFIKNLGEKLSIKGEYSSAWLNIAQAFGINLRIIENSIINDKYEGKIDELIRQDIVPPGHYTANENIPEDIFLSHEIVVEHLKKITESYFGIPEA